MRSASNKPTHVTHGNVLDDLGFSPEQATALKFKAELYQAILRVAKKALAEEIVNHPRGASAARERTAEWRFANKSVDKLLYYAGRLGIETKAKFVQTRKEVVEKELALAE